MNILLVILGYVVAALLTAAGLLRWPPFGVPDARDVAIFEIMVKVARLAETPDHFDSWTDIAGYAACGARCANASPGTTAGK
jgi:hypothetical protein